MRVLPPPLTVPVDAEIVDNVASADRAMLLRQDIMDAKEYRVGFAFAPAKFDGSLEEKVRRWQEKAIASNAYPVIATLQYSDGSTCRFDGRSWSCSGKCDRHGF
jgi:hypothetical protein